MVLFKVMFFQYWNINTGIGAVGEGAGGAGRPCDPELSKSGPSGTPLLACPSQRQFSKPWLLIKHIPWGDLTPPRAIAHPALHRSRFWRPWFHTLGPSSRGWSCPESGVTLTGAPKPLSSKPASVEEAIALWINNLL